MNKFDKIIRENQRQLTPFSIGDTVTVGVRISETEGKGHRVQKFQGVVIGRRGIGNGATFTLRRVTAGQGVERIFPVNSPLLDSVTVDRKASVRRAKLYYLRTKVGKHARLKESAE